MPDTLILEFAEGSADDFNAVNTILGLDLESGSGDWPAGLRHIQAGTTDSGGLVVIENWETREQQEAFMHSRLGPALTQAGVPAPSRVEWFSGLGSHTP
ncbi:MAG: hypothetical protein JWQ32_908 [Marmoricola sp.]|nr:hypothetical protein [Marmoricola sp.]